ncbi:fungal-specific transcription factor domain-containing protein [Aspergillus transmontanensis]|uniref:Fungal-specific transcription factor domain-containing protein n=1 Tax=Aspergillus transmontanensis TaxID=1034304 RepID=A0A5N6WIL7_9EURO|nr:fungal-specific transcription factor domain-containing protein [Aspergillus transmontanensis]
MVITTPTNPPRRLKRKRVGVACNTCRSLKIRCDGVRPHCGTCQRRRDRCIFKDDDLRPLRDGGSPGTREDAIVISPSQLNYGLLCHESASSASSVTTRDTTHDQDDAGVTAMGLTIGPLDRDQNTSREFFGDSSTVAFIQQLQHSIPPTFTGPGSGHEAPCRSIDLHNFDRHPKLPTEPNSSVELLPPRPLADHLVDCYFSKIHTLYPFVHKDAFFSAYRSLWAPSESIRSTNTVHGLGIGDIAVNHTTFHCALNAIFALGCQFSNVVQAQRETTSEAFYRRCKPVLDVEYLEGGDLAVCQTLLLITHYLQCSRTPSRCWHVIGMACRLAQALGLHSDLGNERRSFAEIQLRRRVWHGCVMLDLYAISTILGRPAMIAQKPVTPLPEAIDDCYLLASAPTCKQPPRVLSRVVWFIETLKLYDTLRKILKSLYDNAGPTEAGNHVPAGNTWQIQNIIEIDADLEHFKTKLPEALMWDHEVLRDGPDNFQREKCLLQARFSYLKILLYRPILSQTLRNSNATWCSESNDSTHHAPLYSRVNLDCSIYCVNAAIDLISLVHQTCNTDLSSVWCYNVFYAFTAGSVILLAGLSQSLVNNVTQEALEQSWQKCQSALSKLGLYSSTAERCAENLRTIKARCSITIPHSAMSTTNILSQEQPSANQSPTFEQLDNDEHDDLASEGTEYLPLADDLFRDLDFNEDTFFDPFWFSLQF